MRKGKSTEWECGKCGCTEPWFDPLEYLEYEDDEDEDSCERISLDDARDIYFCSGGDETCGYSRAELESDD